MAFEVSPETYAVMHEAIRVARQRLDEPIDDAAALALLAKSFLAADAEPADKGSMYQVVVSRCDNCKRTFAEADGRSVQLDPATVAAIE